MKSKGLFLVADPSSHHPKRTTVDILDSLQVIKIAIVAGDGEFQSPAMLSDMAKKRLWRMDISELASPFYYLIKMPVTRNETRIVYS